MVAITHLIGALPFEYRLQDVVPRSLSVEVRGKTTDIMIPRNTSIPFECTRNYTTVNIDQKRMLVKILEGEKSRSRMNIVLGMLIISGIPKGPAGSGSVTVTITIDKNGVLNARAKNAHTDESLPIELEGDNLSREDVKRLTLEHQNEIKEQKIETAAKSAASAKSAKSDAFAESDESASDDDDDVDDEDVILINKMVMIDISDTGSDTE